MSSFHCSAILLDLDGVLVDSTRSVDRQWRAWARSRGIDEERVIAIAHGVRTIEVIRQVAPHIDAEAEVLALEKREAADQEGVEVMPGAAGLLASSPRERWCVVTSGTRLLATARLRFGGLPVPDVMVTAEDVKHGKPHPEPYLRGAELLGVPPSLCLVIEDAPAGIQAAKAGGMKVIGLASTYSTSRLGEADAVVQRLAEIRASANGSAVVVEV